MKKQFIIAAMALAILAACSGCAKKDTKTGVEVKEAAKVVELGDYSGLSLEVAEVSEADVEEYINTQLLTPNVDYERITEGTIKEGDLVNINYEGKLNGVAFAGGTDDSEKGTNLEIGSNHFIDGFEDGLIGKKVGETVDLNLTFPENYGNEELNGQDVVFTVQINYLCGDQLLPELNDSFVAENTSYDNVDDYKASIRDSLTQSNQTDAENTVWNQAVSNANISEYPQEYIDRELDNLYNYYSSFATYYNMELDQILSMEGSSEATFREDMLEVAQLQVAQRLVAFAITTAEGIEVTDEIYQSKLEEYVNNYGYESTDALKETIPEKELREQMYFDLGRQFVIEHSVAQ